MVGGSRQRHECQGCLLTEGSSAQSLNVSPLCLGVSDQDGGERGMCVEGTQSLGAKTNSLVTVTADTARLMRGPLRGG